MSTCRLRRLSLCNTLATDVALTAVQDLLLLDELCLDRLRVSSVGVARCIVCLPHLQVLALTWGSGKPVEGGRRRRRGLSVQQLYSAPLPRCSRGNSSLFLVPPPPPPFE